MKKQLLFSALLLCFGFTAIVNAQVSVQKKHNPNEFDEVAALQQAKTKGLKASEWNGYVNAMRLKFSSDQQLKKQTHIHTPYEGGVTGVNETVIYLNPNKVASSNCPNMGFEGYNFTGWTGGTGNVSTGTSAPIYASSGALIVNPAGMNVTEKNVANFHTLLTIPPTNPNGPGYFAAGYDTNATKLVGTAHISQIPLVSPYSFDGVSTRMLGQHANNLACKLKYITTTSTTNKQLIFSYAVVLEDPSGHLAGESPYFKVEVRNETTGALLPGCTSYTFNPKSTLPSDSMFNSSHVMGFDPVKYRKWQLYSVDLSSLPLGTNVSLNFEVGGCSLGGHAGYAYVDAECGGLGVPYVNMCGSSFATLVAPSGFNSYQWIELPANTPIAGATNDTLIIPSVTTNTLYAVQMVSPGGCTLTLTDTIKNTTVNIININSSASCAGGASGSANVTATGSNGVYTYTWVNTATGAVVSHTQTPIGLPAGNYSVTVASTSCGFASAIVNVPTAPPFYLTQTKPFCGNSTYIAVPGGSNYQWYAGSGSTATLVAGSAGTNDTLKIATAVDGADFTLVYTTSSGCKDSVKYTLGIIPGGNSFINNQQNVCPGSSNGSANVNLNTPFAAPYSYNVVGPTGVVASASASSATFIPVSNLSAASYTYMIDDGVCLYNGTFTITPIQTNFSVTPTNSVLCFPTDVATLNLDFGATVPQNCGLSTSGGCSSPNNIQIGTGSTMNTSTTYPAIYSNWYRNARHQILYRASELLAAGIQPGKISSIAFNIATINGTTSYPDFTVKMKCTPSNDLSNLTFETGLTQVYYSPSINISAGWNTYTFPTPYEWNGVDNLLIDVCTSQTAGFTLNSLSPYTATSFVSVRYFNSDATVACPIVMANSSSSNRPNVKFENCGSVNPASYTVTVSSNGTVTANYNNDSLKVVPTFTAPPAGNVPVVYTLTVVNPIGGCVKTQTVAVIYPSGKAVVTAAANPTTVCEGSSLNITSVGGVNYQWFYGSVAPTNSIATTQSITVTPPMVGNNFYYVIGSSSCAGTIDDTAKVTVNVTPKANLLIAPHADVTKCMNKNYVISTGVGSASSGNTGAPYSYAWTTLPSNAAAPGVNNAASYTVSSNGTTTMVVTVNGVCANPTKDTVVIKNYINDLAIAVANSATVCANSPLTLNTITNGGHPVYNYNWTVPPNSASISNQQNLTINAPDAEGTYTVAVLVVDSCEYAQIAYQVFAVLPPCNVVIPNVMSANNDGLNDVFLIKNLEHHPNTAVTIFDRWGKKVFESPNYQNDWRANGISDGTFFYVIDVPDDKKYNGFITIFHGK